MKDVYNFAPGPALLPQEVMFKAKEEFLDWNELGLSVMEVSHRSKDFLELAELAEKNLRILLEIPNNYNCLLYTSPSPRDVEESRMPSSA